MKILALDTSNVALSVAVLENDQLLAIQTTNIKRNHSKQLMPIISQTLKTAEVSLADLDRIVVVKGPGSYTGLRIAVTTAKTLAMTLEIELVGISSLAMLVPNAPNDGLVVPFFDARNQNVFAGIYEKHGMEVTPVVADQHLSFESLLAKINELGRSVYFINNHFEKFQPMVEDTLRVIAEHSTTLNSLPNAYALGLLGLQKQALENYYTFVPAYLRVTEAERNWKEKHPNDESKESYVRQIN
ncbi:tRNA (adenosine(37)-N6)-threonylcarbamoyltransferase complex dimerization subunit type 1 TsaB [Pediococcus acidilactici]|uniref:tRNA (adenosine(37)-N6)-threonylcarbamoyltransferase complex dimerization subunit type 1 TsaB n=1 Tax=Pediococcus acidilactici TaxID=1254 RepID=UPI0020730642|nr:tRNA (adenosine(37)-N6)-threonylcarbamoyltransferase complex dimerization subunit type 1 TsaB [Pediococcus acidilactici]